MPYLIITDYDARDVEKYRTNEYGDANDYAEAVEYARVQPNVDSVTEYVSSVGDWRRTTITNIDMTSMTIELTY